MKLNCVTNTELVELILENLQSALKKENDEYIQKWGRPSLHALGNFTGEGYGSDQYLDNISVTLVHQLIDWSSEEEKIETLDYMRQHAIAAQTERDFCPSEDADAPAYEMWSPIKTIDMLMTYRNNSKLKQATVNAHRDFILSRIQPLLDTNDEVIWIYRKADRLIDRGYSLQMLPIIKKVKAIVKTCANYIGRQAQVAEATHHLKEAEQMFEKASQALNLERTMLS